MCHAWQTASPQLAEHLLHLVEESLRDGMYLFSAEARKFLQQLALLGVAAPEAMQRDTTADEEVTA